MQEDAAPRDASQDLRSKLRVRRIIVPIVLGMAAAAWLLIRDLSEPGFEPAPDGSGGYTWTDGNGNGWVDAHDVADFAPTAEGSGAYRRMTPSSILGTLHWGGRAVLFLALAICAAALRDVGYIIRLRSLTDGQLGWRSAFNAVVLWEFATAMAPAVIGGTSLAILILDREGIGLGRSTAVVLVTAMLDELFFLLAVPLLFARVGITRLFPPHLDEAFGGVPIMWLFWAGYVLMGMMKVGVLYAVFIRPRAFKFALLWCFKWRLLRRWRPLMRKTGDDLMRTSDVLKGKPFGFWASAFVTTALSWGARFLVIVCIAAAFYPIREPVLLYTRQLVMWVVLLISPTPGGSGVAEMAFSGFFRDLLPATAFIGAIAILWRLLTYYLYLFIGVITLPRWLRRTGRKG